MAERQLGETNVVRCTCWINSVEGALVAIAAAWTVGAVRNKKPGCIWCCSKQALSPLREIVILNQPRVQIEQRDSWIEKLGKENHRTEWLKDKLPFISKVTVLVDFHAIGSARREPVTAVTWHVERHDKAGIIRDIGYLRAPSASIFPAPSRQMGSCLHSVRAIKFGFTRWTRNT